MSDTKPNEFVEPPLLVKWAKAFWRGLDLSRRVAVNLLFVLLLAALVAIPIVSNDGPEYAEKNALVLMPKGALVEQLASSPMTLFIGQLTGTGVGEETLLRDLLDTIRVAKDDDRIRVLVVDLSKFGGGGLTKLQDLGRAIDEFRESGKPVIATADSYSQSAYYLASRADEVYMNPVGFLMLSGYGFYGPFFGDAIDRLEIDWNIFKVGTFKSAVEPFMRSDMSPAAKEANLAYLDDIWNAYVKDVAAARKIDEMTVRDYAQNPAEHIEGAGGDTAQAALAAGFIDRVATRDELRARVIEIVGENEDTHSFHQVSDRAYLAEHRRGQSSPDTDAVGIIVARGAIMDGTRPAGTIGGDSLAKLIRQARHDEEIKIIVLRVDSPGGSVFGSEVIRRELEITRAAGKKIVISMGSLAASGGYWISTPADEIWAHPTTLTGSIGIFGMWPTFQKPLEKLAHVRVDGVGTAPGVAVRIDTALPSEMARAFQSSIERGYERFITLVAESRAMTPEAVDAIAQGRIWSGTDAHERGLVDELGSLADAVHRAAELAELGDDFDTRYVEPKKSFRDRVIERLFVAATATLTQAVSGGTLDAGPYTQLLRFIHEQTRVLSTLNDPQGIYAYELFEVN